MVISSKKHNNGSQSSNMGVAFEMAFITTYFLWRIECSNALSITKFDSPSVNTGGLSLWNWEHSKTGNMQSLQFRARLPGGTALSYQVSANIPSLEKTMAAFSPKEIHNTLRPFKGWYNKWDALATPGDYAEWEGEDDYTLKLPAESWFAASTNNKTESKTPKAISKSKLFTQYKKNDLNRRVLTTREVVARLLMNILLLFTAAAKFVISV